MNFKCSVAVALITGFAFVISLTHGSINDCDADIAKLADMGMPLTHEVDYAGSSCAVDMFDWRCNYYNQMILMTSWENALLRMA